MPEGGTKRKEADDGEELDSALNPARGYPRKRVAVACEVCRLRKTKCDAKSPCTFCVAAGIECVYRQANPADRPSAATDILQRIEERLARLEHYLNPNQVGSDAGETPRSIGRTPQEQPPLPARSRSLISEYRNFFQRSVSVPPYDFSFRQTSGEAISARPSLVSFNSPAYIDFQSWDDTGSFYDEEMVIEEQMFKAMTLYNKVSPDLSARTAWRLQSVFIHNYLQWMPLFDLKALVEHIRIAQTSKFAGGGPSECLVLFAFAIAAETEDKTPYNQAQMLEKHPASWSYFWRAREILITLPVKTRRDVTVLQCRILRACYYQLLIRPLLAWDAVTEAGRDLMHVLSSDFYKNMSDDARDSIHRLFWACSILIHELEAILKTHPIGLRQFHEVVPLPLPDTEEEGFYYFFAQATVRKLLTEIQDVVGYRIGQVVYAPLVAAELRKQAEQWYDHLPPPVKFPLTASPLFDLRKSYLRMQYMALHAVVYWPSVLQVIKEEALPTADSQVNGLASNTREEASECIRNCILCQQLSEELVMQRHMGLQFTVWATYATMCMLLITYQQDCFAYIPETRDDTYIRKGFASLHHWADLPVLKRALRRTRSQLLRAGIPIEMELPA